MIDESEQVERIIASSLVLQEIEECNDKLYKRRANCFTKTGEIKDKKELKKINNILISNNRLFDKIVNGELLAMQNSSRSSYKSVDLNGGNPKNTKCEFYPNRFARKSVDLNKSSSSES